MSCGTKFGVGQGAEAKVASWPTPGSTVVLVVELPHPARRAAPAARAATIRVVDLMSRNHVPFQKVAEIRTAGCSRRADDLLLIP